MVARESTWDKYLPGITFVVKKWLGWGSTPLCDGQLSMLYKGGHLVGSDLRSTPLWWVWWPIWFGLLISSFIWRSSGDAGVFGGPELGGSQF